MMLYNKRGAIELSVSTIVIVVLAMSMLILGVVLVKNIFTGVTYNVDQVNDNVKAKINELFNERDSRIAVYLPNNGAEVKQGKTFGVAIGIKNNVEGEAQAGKFTYTTKAVEVQTGCALSVDKANGYISLGKTNTFELMPGQIKTDMIKLTAPPTAPLCEIKYIIDVTKDGQAYDSTYFFLKVK